MTGLCAAMTPARSRSPYENPPGRTMASRFLDSSCSCHKSSVFSLKTSVSTCCISRSQLLPGKTTKDVALLMSKKQISSLVVIKDGNPIGLVTERDLSRKVLTTDRKSSDVQLSEI